VNYDEDDPHAHFKRIFGIDEPGNGNEESSPVHFKRFFSLTQDEPLKKSFSRSPTQANKFALRRKDTTMRGNQAPQTMLPMDLLTMRKSIMRRKETLRKLTRHHR
jgi:hypothetical protein